MPRPSCAYPRGHVVGSIHDLGSQTLAHGALAALAGEHNQPAQSQSLAALRADFNGDLVGGTADAAGLNFQGRHDVGHGSVEHFDGFLAGLLSNGLQSFVANGLRYAALAVVHDLVDQLGDNGGIVYRIRKHFALRDKSTTRHGSPSLILRRLACKN